LRFKSKITPRNISISPYYNNLINYRVISISSPSTYPYPLIHSTITKLSDSQYSEYLNNDQYFHYGKSDQKVRDYYSYLIELIKGRSDNNPMKYIKKETVNIIEVDSESDSSQYSILIIKIPILISNSKDKKIFEEVLMDYGVIISIIDTEIIKEKNLRMESSSK
jgi:hypothetical protein